MQIVIDTEEKTIDIHGEGYEITGNMHNTELTSQQRAFVYALYLVAFVMLIILVLSG